MSLGVGDQLPLRTFGPVELESTVRYAGASGDFNPIHYDADYARSSGYPTAFAQGMLQAALSGTAVVEWIAGGTVRAFRVRFRDQVWLGDILRIRGTVSAVERVADASIVTIDIDVTTDPGERRVLTGTTTVHVPDDSTD